MEKPIIYITFVFGLEHDTFVQEETEMGKEFAIYELSFHKINFSKKIFFLNQYIN